MKPEAKELALAILTRVQERAGTINKTKLLKLLYLADIEHFRKHDETLTGFDWRFHLYGPWASEFDQLLNDLMTADSIEVQPWSKDDLNGNRISSLESRDLNRVIADTDEYYRIQRIIDTWTDRSLSDLLDYVYFETEPMKGAVSQQKLSFNTVSKELPKLYRRLPSGADPRAMGRLRARLQSLQKQNESRRDSATALFRPPRYDEVYSDALNQLADDEA